MSNFTQLAIGRPRKRGSGVRKANQPQVNAVTTAARTRRIDHFVDGFFIAPDNPQDGHTVAGDRSKGGRENDQRKGAQADPHLGRV